MSAAVADLLPDLDVAEPQQAAGLTVFGLRGPDADPTDYATLDDALAARTLEVTELSEGGTVPTLKGVLPAPSADTPLPAALARDEGYVRIPEARAKAK